MAEEQLEWEQPEDMVGVSPVLVLGLSLVGREVGKELVQTT